MTRVLPCREGPIRAALRANRKILGCTPGNNRRALGPYFDHLCHTEVMALEIPLAALLA